MGRENELDDWAKRILESPCPFQEIGESMSKKVSTITLTYPHPNPNEIDELPASATSDRPKIVGQTWKVEYYYLGLLVSKFFDSRPQAVDFMQSTEQRNGDQQLYHYKLVCIPEWWRPRETTNDSAH